MKKDGQDLYDFIKTYNKNTESGIISDRAQKLMDQGELYALAFRETIKNIKMGNVSKNKGADLLASLVTNPTARND